MIWRELVTITRTPAYWAGAAVYVVALAAFVMVWGDGIPVAGARSSWQQFVSAETAILAVLLPWIATRCGSSSRRELVMIGFVSARSPAHCLAARSIALTVALIGVELSGLPVITLMQQIAVTAPFRLVMNVFSVAVLATSVAILTTGIALLLANPIPSWIASTALTLVIVAGRLPPATELSLLAGTGVVAAFYLFAMRARLIYLPEHET